MNLLGMLGLRGLLTGGAMIAAAGFLWWLVDEIGDKREAEIRREIAHENQKATDAARAAIDRVRACYARDGMRWDRSIGQCVRRL